MSRRKYTMPGAPVVVCRRWKAYGHGRRHVGVFAHRALDRQIWRTAWADKRRAEAGRWYSGAPS